MSPTVPTLMDPTQQIATKIKRQEILLGLLRRAREADTLQALRFIVVNDTHLLSPYRQAVLWSKSGGVECLSGLMQVESNAPYAHWLDRLFAAFAGKVACRINRSDLEENLAEDWTQWFSECAVWIPLGKTMDRGLIFSRPMDWSDEEFAFLQEWVAHWDALARGFDERGMLWQLRSWLGASPSSMRRRPIIWILALLALLFIPVRLSVLAPAELVPRDPWIVRAPFDGTLDRLQVDTNQVVKAGDALFEYDTSLIESRLEVVKAELATAESEYRQASQLAMQSIVARGNLPAAKGKVEERRLELRYLEERLEKSAVSAEVDGVVFVDSPENWAGRPLVAGQQVLRLVEPSRMEVEAWLGVGDAIALETGDSVRLYLSSSPLDPVICEIRYISHEAFRRPNGSYAYRVRATIVDSAEHRVGLKGTARLTAGRVPLVYWALRRPLAAAREFFAW